MNQSAQRPADALRLVVVDVTGLPGVPGVGGFRPKPAGHRHRFLHREPGLAHRHTDFGASEFTGSVPGVTTGRLAFGDDLAIAAGTGIGELHHHGGAARLSFRQFLVLGHQLLDQRGRPAGVLVRRFPHTEDATTGVRHSAFEREDRAASRSPLDQEQTSCCGTPRPWVQFSTDELRQTIWSGDSRRGSGLRSPPAQASKMRVDSRSIRNRARGNWFERLQ